MRDPLENLQNPYIYFFDFKLRLFDSTVLFLQGDQLDLTLGNQQTAVINLGVGGFMSPQAAGMTQIHTYTQICIKSH